MLQLCVNESGTNLTEKCSLFAFPSFSPSAVRGAAAAAAVLVFEHLRRVDTSAL